MKSCGTSWWRGATLYQIYPRSFADGNGDGIGDLAGITQRLAYVAELGVDGIWLSPIFPSPMRDFGYDVSDHRGVDPMFGSLADLDELVTRAHDLGLKVLIDQVWSHTAAEHPWFIESRSSRNNAKADWYVWADARPDGSPPNNWLSWMGGPAWRWEPRRRQYHLHNFLPEMPDLNFHCGEVQDAILDVARFWLERGIDGFRLDTANLYFHDRSLADNPPSANPGDVPVLMQQHLNNADQPETPWFLERLRALMDRHGATMAVGEVGGADPMATMRDYSSGSSRLHTCYSFAMLGGRPSCREIASQMVNWQEQAGEAWPSWSFSNHDVARVATRWATSSRSGSFVFGGETPTGASSSASPELHLALLLALRGTIFVYQGEELGLTQAEIAFEDLQDPFGKANWPVNPGRDGCRTPMPWSAEGRHAGFSTAQKTWLPLYEPHRSMAVDQQASEDSTLETARRLISLRRRSPALRLGSFEPLPCPADVLFAFRRHPRQTMLVAFNLGDRPETMELPPACNASVEAFSLAGAYRDGRSVVLPAGSALFIEVNET